MRTKLLQSAQLGGYVHAGLEDMVKEYDRRFGLDQPLWRQYLTYLRATARLDFNYSIANYPRTVREMIAEAVPWTVGLLGTTTLLSFAHRHAAGRAARLAWCAALDALADAAVMGAACHSVLSARPDPDVPAGIPGAAAADLRRLHRRARSRRFRSGSCGTWCRTRCCPRCRSCWWQREAGRWRCAA